MCLCLSAVRASHRKRAWAGDFLPKEELEKFVPRSHLPAGSSAPAEPSHQTAPNLAVGKKLLEKMGWKEVRASGAPQWGRVRVEL